MLEIERTLDIDATPEKAWAVLGRFMHIDQFHPRISKVDVLSEAQTGTGARRRCHFKDGSSVVEEVIDWQEGRSYRAQLSGFSMPLNTAIARLAVEPLGEGRTRLSMGMQYEVKYGPIGWVLGKTMMANMMGKLFMVVLKGLEERVVTGKAPSA